MNNFDYLKYLYNNPLLNENKTSPTLKKGEVNVVDFILGGEDVNEAGFDKIRDKFNKALKKGAMTLGVLAAVLGSPNMAQAQKTQLKKDVTDSTWFLDSQENFKNNPMEYSQLMGYSVDNPNFDQDLKDKREVGTTNAYSLEKWVNNLGQDSTVYKQYQDLKHVDGGHEYSNLGDPVKTVVNKDVKPWKTADWSQITKKGNIGNYLWSKDKTKSITPGVHKELKKLDKGKKYNNKDRESVKAKQYKDGGFSASDFYTVDLDIIQSPGQ